VPEVGGVHLAAELAADADEEVAVERRLVACVDIG
jgi:hypothetical protein